MQIKFLKSIVENLINKPAVPIVDLLVGKKDVNEFLIAKKLEMTINQTRNILYKLSDYGLVSFIRKKDKKKGWYIYFWTLNVYQSLNFLETKLKEELVQLESQLRNRREKRYFICKTCSIEMTEEAALANNFICSECEDVYELSNNKEVIEQIEKDIDAIKKEIELVSKEKEIEGGKLDKKKAKKIKKAEVDKKEKRDKLREASKKEAAKLANKEELKKPKNPSKNKKEKKKLKIKKDTLKKQKISKKKK
jgi:transcription factor E